MNSLLWKSSKRLLFYFFDANVQFRARAFPRFRLDDVEQPDWRRFFDSENCRNILSASLSTGYLCIQKSGQSRKMRSPIDYTGCPKPSQLPANHECQSLALLSHNIRCPKKKHQGSCFFYRSGIFSKCEPGLEYRRNRPGLAKRRTGSQGLAFGSPFNCRLESKGAGKSRAPFE